MSLLDTLVQQSGGGGTSSHQSLSDLVKGSGTQSAQTIKNNTIQANSAAAAKAVSSVPNPFSASSLINAAGAVFGGSLKAATAPIKDTFVGSRDLTTGAIADAMDGRSTTGGLLEGVKIVAGYAGMAYSPFAGIFNPIGNLINAVATPTIEGLSKTPPIDYVGRKIADIPGFSTQKTQDTAETVLNLLNYSGQISMGIIGAKGGEPAKGRVEQTVAEKPQETLPPKTPSSQPPPQPPQQLPPQANTRGIPSTDSSVNPLAEATTKVPSTQDPLVNIRASKSAHDINEVLVERGAPETALKDMTPTQVTSYTADKQATLNLLDTNAKLAESVAKGEVSAKSVGIDNPEIIFNSVVAKAMKENDTALLRDLQKSPLAGLSSEHGRGLGATAFSRLEHSTVDLAREVQQARESVLQKKSGESIQSVIKRGKKQIANTTTKSMVRDFINSIPDC